MNGVIKPEQIIPRAEQKDSGNLSPEIEPSLEQQNEQVQNQIQAVNSNIIADQLRQSIAQVPSSEQEIILEKVEKILAEDMDNIFLSLDVNKQVEFKKRGEETSRQIAKLLTKATVPVKKIVNLIIAWLRVIPHVNRFYLEQEAKIKTDKIIQIKFHK